MRSVFFTAWAMLHARSRDGLAPEVLGVLVDEVPGVDGVDVAAVGVEGVDVAAVGVEGVEVAAVGVEGVGPVPIGVEGGADVVLEPMVPAVGGVVPGATTAC